MVKEQSIVNIKDETLEIPKRIERVRKDVRKYEENVNKCNIHETNILTYNIGSDIDYLKFSDLETTTEQKKEIENLEDQFITNMDRLVRCRCVRKIEK